MVLKRFAAVPGSTILGAPRGTGRSGSLPFLSFPYSRKPAADLTGCHKDRKGQAKLTHSCSLSHLHTVFASLQKPSWTQVVGLGWAAGCPSDTGYKPTPTFAGPSQDQSGQSSWVWQPLTTGHDHFASDHTGGRYLRESITARSGAESQHTHLPAGQSSAQSTSTCFWRPQWWRRYLRCCNPAQPNFDKWWITSCQLIRAILQREQSSGKRNPSHYISKQRKWAK